MSDKTEITLVVQVRAVNTFSPNVADSPARAESLGRINHYLENNFTLE